MTGVAIMHAADRTVIMFVRAENVLALMTALGHAGLGVWALRDPALRRTVA